MLKSCKYCGKIHDSKYNCPRKPVRDNKATDIDKFRWTKAWQKKRNQINKRDNYMCQICIRKLYGTQHQYNYEDIEVHHIVSIAEDYSLRLEDSNLICLCSHHHKMAELKKISKEELRIIVAEQESNA